MGVEPTGPQRPPEAVQRAWGQRSSVGGLQTLQAGSAAGPGGQPCPLGRRFGLPRRCDGSEVLPHGLDHSSPPDPEAGADSNSSIKQQPDGGRCFLQDCALLVNQPQGYQGTDGVTGKEEKRQ